MCRLSRGQVATGPMALTVARIPVLKPTVRVAEGAWVATVPMAVTVGEVGTTPAPVQTVLTAGITGIRMVALTLLTITVPAAALRVSMVSRTSTRIPEPAVPRACRELVPEGQVFER